MNPRPQPTDPNQPCPANLARPADPSQPTPANRPQPTLPGQPWHGQPCPANRGTASLARPAVAASRPQPAVAPPPPGTAAAVAQVDTPLHGAHRRPRTTRAGKRIPPRHGRPTPQHCPDREACTSRWPATTHCP
jgi:hypothetical protein